MFLFPGGGRKEAAAKRRPESWQIQSVSDRACLESAFARSIGNFSRDSDPRGKPAWPKKSQRRGPREPVLTKARSREEIYRDGTTFSVKSVEERGERREGASGRTEDAAIS